MSDFLNYSWVQNDSLSEVVVRIHELYLSKPDHLNGELLGFLAKRLIENEIEVGGPYLSRDDLYTNIVIMRLFETLGAPLRNLETFLLNKTYTPKNNQQRLALSLPLNANQTSTDLMVPVSNKAIDIALDTMSTLNPENKITGLNYLKKIIKLDKKSEISQITTYVLYSLITPPTRLEAQNCEKMGAANIYAWISYTIYDDFIDNEGNAKHLSLANIMHRHSFAQYERLFRKDTKIINNYFDSVDNSNLWELSNCRAEIKTSQIIIKSLPDYGNGQFLADRSLGHFLGPKLLLKNRKISKQQELCVDAAFNQFLIAKQLHDDLVDWESDLRAGQLSYVVTELLRTIDIQPGEYEINELIDRLRIECWRTVFQNCLTKILKELSSSKKSLEKSKLFQSNSLFIDNVIEPLRQTTEEIYRRNQESKNFLKSYTN